MIDKYAPLMKAQMEKFAAQYKVKGPFNPRDMDQMQNSLSQDVAAELNKIMTQMDVERRALQQKIDSLEEYDRLSRMCQAEDRDLIQRGIIQRR